MLTEINLHVIINEADKFNKIQLLKNHDLIIINLILMNNFYFLNVVKDLILIKNLSIQVNVIIADKKPNHKQ